MDQSQEDYQNFWDRWPQGHLNTRLDYEIREYVDYCALLKHEEVLEIGCGAGISPELIGPLTATSVYCDFHYPAVKTQKTQRNADVIQCDGRCLPFSDERFDKILTRTTVQHFPNQEDISLFFGEVARVLKYQGLFIVSRLANRLGGYLSLHHYMMRKHIRRWILGKGPYFTPQSIPNLRDLARGHGLRLADIRVSPQAGLAPNLSTAKGRMIYKCLYKMGLPYFWDNPRFFEFVDLKFVKDVKPAHRGG